MAEGIDAVCQTIRAENYSKICLHPNDWLLFIWL